MLQNHQNSKSERQVPQGRQGDDNQPVQGQGSNQSLHEAQVQNLGRRNQTVNADRDGLSQQQRPAPSIRIFY